MDTLFKNSAHLLSANIVAQAIGLIIYPILTRIYSPEDFGLLNLFLSIGSILTLLALAEYYYAIVLAKNNSQANGMVQVCSLLLVIMVGLVTLTIPFSKSIAGLFNTPSLADYWWLMPIFVGLTGLWNILNYWYIRCSEFKRVSGYQISQSVLSAGCKMGFGYAGFLQGGLIVSMVIAPLVSIFVSISISWKKCLHNLHLVPWPVCKAVASEYKNFPAFDLPRGLVNLVGGYLPVLVLTPLFGSANIGLWSMAILLGFAPISMITKSLYQTFYQHINSQIQQRQKIGSFFLKFTGWTTSVVAPCFVGLYFILPWLTRLLLGAEWETSGYYLRWMLPWIFCSLLTACTCFLADIFYRQKVGLYFELLLAILRAIGIGVGCVLHDFEVAIIGYAMGSLVAILAQYIWLMSLVRKYDQSLSSDGKGL